MYENIDNTEKIAIIKSKGKKDVNNNCSVKMNLKDNSCNHSKKMQLNCMYTNCRSLWNKKDELEWELINNEIDILGITESWGNENIDDAEIHFNGYSLFRKDDKQSRGGGVVLYIIDRLIVVQVKDVNDDSDSECESLWVKFQDSQNRDIYLGIYYRSLSASRKEDNIIFDEIKKLSCCTS